MHAIAYAAANHTKRFLGRHLRALTGRHWQRTRVGPEEPGRVGGISASLQSISRGVWQVYLLAALRAPREPEGEHAHGRPHKGACAGP
jgi:hypothetical protein